MPENGREMLAVLIGLAFLLALPFLAVCTFFIAALMSASVAVERSNVRAPLVLPDGPLAETASSDETAYCRPRSSPTGSG